MPIGDRIGGFIKPGYFPLKIPDAPTIGAATSGGSLAISIAFTAPSDVGGGAITSYEAVATDTVTAATFTASGTSSPISITGLTNGQTYTVTVSAINAYGPSAISAASNSFKAVAIPSTLYAWGTNTYGALGLGDTTNRNSPVQVGTLTNWELVAVGGAYGSQPSTVAVKTDGTIWSWGRNTYGELGTGNTTDFSSPVQIGALTTWSKIATGRHTLAVKTDGTLWAWGRGGFGSLGQGNTTDYSSPVQVGALTTWLDVSASYSLSLLLKTDGTMWAMGSNNYGQIGDGSTANKSSPVQIGALTTWSKIAAGGWWAAALKTDGTIWAWGANNAGQLGQGDTTATSSPVQVGALTTWSEISGSDSGYGLDGNCLANKNDGTMWAWGRNNEGQLAQGDKVDTSSPVQIGALTTWSKSSAGYRGGQAIKTDGTLWTWGWNGDGNLGIGGGADTSSPVQVGALTSWLVIPIGNDGPQRMALQ